MCRLILILTAFATQLISQTTWGGLRFGMTETEVKAALKDQLQVSIDESGAQRYKIKSVKVGPTTGTGDLSFDPKDKTLLSIWLDFSYEERTLRELPVSDVVDRVLAYEYVSKQLLERYGRPLIETGRCPAVDEVRDHLNASPLNTIKLDTLKCDRLWKEPSQTLETNFSLVGNWLLLTVKYKAPSVASAL